MNANNVPTLPFDMISMILNQRMQMKRSDRMKKEFGHVINELKNINEKLLSSYYGTLDARDQEPIETIMIDITQTIEDTKEQDKYFFTVEVLSHITYIASHNNENENSRSKFLLDVVNEENRSNESFQWKMRTNLSPGCFSPAIAMDEIRKNPTLYCNAHCFNNHTIYEPEQHPLL